LKGWSLDEIAIKNGITNVIDNTSLHGRWETISTSPLIILDVAHNADGMQKMIEQLNRFKFENLYLVIGMSSDKDVNEVLALLPKHANYAFTKANLPRAMDPGELKKMAENYGLKGDVYLNVNEALSTFKERAKEGDIVLVCGSIFVVGEVDRKRLT
jgi:dihydrofolate synthase/folylpolyglutamate synthase